MAAIGINGEYLSSRNSRYKMIDRKTRATGALAKRRTGIIMVLLPLMTICFNNLYFRLPIRCNGILSAGHNGKPQDQECHYGSEKFHKGQK